MKKAFLQLHLAVFLAGFTGVLGRLITINEALLVWYRMFFSALILLAISMFTKKIKLLHWKEMLPLIGIGGIIALHWVSFYGSIKYANISVALVCFSSVGFFSSFLDPLISNRKIIMTEVLLGLMVMLGVYLIFHFDQHFRTGILFGIISAFLATLFPILNKRFVGKHGADTITFYEIGGGWMVLNLVVPIYLLYTPVDSYLPNAKDLLWLLFLSLFCTVLAFNMSVRALSRISPFTVNLSFNLEPVYGILLAFLIYNEHKMLGPSFYVGISIIILTVVLQTLKVWRDSKTQLDKN
jgi:drug/metabolite transporter (DMT)-like permease